MIDWPHHLDAADIGAAHCICDTAPQHAGSIAADELPLGQS